MPGNVVLGLDPGTRHFGWGVVERRGTRLFHRGHGVIDTDEKAPIAVRLVTIERELVEVVRAQAPEVSSVEALFFAKDPQAAAKLGHARGVALLVCARAGLEVFEYAPARVKLAVVGSGRADKAQVAQMIRVVLGLAARRGGRAGARGDPPPARAAAVRGSDTCPGRSSTWNETPAQPLAFRGSLPHAITRVRDPSKGHRFRIPRERQNEATPLPRPHRALPVRQPRRGR
jgi:crossover junction endodeoxyribonuclease RuvC